MRKSKMLKRIENMYEQQNLEFLPTFEKSKIILELYRDVVWSLKNRVGYLVCESQETYGKDLDAAFIYLASFSSESKRREFESRVSRLFESKWLIELIDKAMSMIKDYPEHGKTYYQILTHCYLQEQKCKDEVIMQKVCLERTSYYQRKREAISLLGVSLWGFELPRLLNELKTPITNDGIYN